MRKDQNFGGMVEEETISLSKAEKRTIKKRKSDKKNKSLGQTSGQIF